MWACSIRRVKWKCIWRWFFVANSSVYTHQLLTIHSLLQPLRRKGFNISIFWSCNCFFDFVSSADCWAGLTNIKSFPICKHFCTLWLTLNFISSVTCNLSTTTSISCILYRSSCIRGARSSTSPSTLTFKNPFYEYLQIVLCNVLCGIVLMVQANLFLWAYFYKYFTISSSEKFYHFFACVVAISLSHSCIQQAQKVINFGNSTYGASWVFICSFCSIEITGESPVILSTSYCSISPTNCLA